MADIITLGELLVDLTQSGTDEKGNSVFTAYPGGAPANVAVAATRLGARTAFIGKVGDDAFGRSLEETLIKEGVDTAGLYVSEDVPTTLAIASIDESGERSFSFYRSPGADTQLTEDEATAAIDGFINEGLPYLAAISSPDDADDESDRYFDLPVGYDETPVILHAGSLSMTTSPSREACLEAAGFAKAAGMLVSYDPNYREALWKSKEEAIEQMKTLLPYTDILKVSDEEMEMLSGTSDPDKGSAILAACGDSTIETDERLAGRRISSQNSLPARRPTSNFAACGARHTIPLVMVTLGGEGVYIRFGEHGELIPGFKVDVADTNGAGDTFMGAMLAQIISSIRKTEMAASGRKDHYRSLRQIGWFRLRDMAVYANKAASITCSRSGAIPAMPTVDEIGLK